MLICLRDAVCAGGPIADEVTTQLQSSICSKAALCCLETCRPSLREAASSSAQQVVVNKLQSSASKLGRQVRSWKVSAGDGGMSAALMQFLLPSAIGL